MNQYHVSIIAQKNVEVSNNTPSDLILVSIVQGKSLMHFAWGLGNGIIKIGWMSELIFNSEFQVKANVSSINWKIYI